MKAFVNIVKDFKFDKFKEQSKKVQCILIVLSDWEFNYSPPPPLTPSPSPRWDCSLSRFPTHPSPSIFSSCLQEVLPKNFAQWTRRDWNGQSLNLEANCITLNWCGTWYNYYDRISGKKESDHKEDKGDEKLPSSIGSVLCSFRDFCAIMWLLHARDKMSKSSRKYRQLRSQSTGSEQVYTS